MTFKTIVSIAVLLTATAAQAAPKPHRTAPAAKPAAAAAAPDVVETGGSFDARNPSSLAALLASLGAKAQTTNRDKQDVLLKVTSPAGDFSAQFDGCNAQGRACQALQFDAAAAAKTATVAEVNSFNQSSLACRIIQDKAGKPHVLYSALVFASTTRADMLTHVNAWRGCLSDFSAFLKDPPGYLAAAP